MGNICNAQPSLENEDVKIKLAENNAYEAYKDNVDTKRFSASSDKLMTSPSWFSNDDGERMFTRETNDDDCPETTAFALSPS